MITNTIGLVIIVNALFPTIQGELNHGIGIIHGQNASIKDYPYMAELKLSGWTVGAGLILNKHWILSTATGVAGMNASLFEFRVGSTTSGSGGQTLSVTKIISHPKWLGMYDHNVAVVKVSPSIQFGDSVKSIPLGTRDLPAGTKTTIAGWGEVEPDGDYTSPVLLAANVTVLSRAKCKKTYHKQITGRVLCTKKSASNPCTGDIGSPLVSDGVAYGLFAGGLSCQPGLYPYVYTNIPSFRKWIHSIIKKHSSG